MQTHEAIAAMQEALATLYAVKDRLGMSNLEGEESPYIEDCSNAIAELESVLSSAGVR